MAEDEGNIRILYVQKEKEEAECLIDFIYDDMAEHDAGITEYDEAEYEDKCGRDSLREMLRSESLPIGRAVICLYDSEKDTSETILEGYIAQDYIQFGGYLYEGGIKGNPVAVYDYAGKEELGNVSSLSELWKNGDIYNVYDTVEECLLEKFHPHLIVGSQAAEILPERHILTQLRPDRKNGCLYVSVRSEETGASEIGKIVCAGSGFGTYETMYEDGYWISDYQDGNLVYFRYIDGDRGELYCNEDRVDSDVYMDGCMVCDDGSIVYYQDMSDGYKAALKLYDGRQRKKIADEVSDYCYFNKRKIAILVDYDRNSCKGELKLYNGKELVTVDEDVEGIVAIKY